MIRIEAMMVCLDLSDIDEKLVSFSRAICQRLEVAKVYFVHNIKLFELGEDFREMIGEVDISREVELTLADLVAERFENTAENEILVSMEPNTEVILADLVKRYGIKLTLLARREATKAPARWEPNCSACFPAVCSCSPKQPACRSKRFWYQ